MPITEEQISKEEAIARITSQTPLTRDDVLGIMACTPEQVGAVVKGYIDSGVHDAPSTWDTVVKVFTVCSAVANLVIPIVSVVGAVKNL